MSLARREILKAAFIGLLIAAVVFAIFTLAMSVMQRQFTIDTEGFNSVVEWGKEVDLEGVTIIDNRTLGMVKTPLTKDMLVSIEEAEQAGKLKIVFEHLDEEFVLYVDVKYRVDFLSYGEVIDSQLVFKADELNPPTPTPKFGQEFCGWDVDLSDDLTKSIQVNAIYKTIEYPALEIITATYGDTLGVIKLPENNYGKWEFTDSADTTVGDAGSHEFEVKFTFYSNPEWVKYDSVKINVEKKHIEFKDVNDSFIYDGKEHFPTYKIDEDLNVFVVGSPNTEAGEYEYSFEILEANYEGSYSGTYKIAKPDVTVSVSSATVYYGEDVPEFTYTVKGFDNVELLGIEIDAPMFISKAGEFEIGITYTNDNVNYIIQKGLLTVLKADQDAPAPELSKVTYGDKLGDITFEGRYLGTWKWEDPNIVVDDMNGISAWAIYTHDNENYNQVRVLVEITEIHKRVLEINVLENEFVYKPGTAYSLIYVIADGSYEDLVVTGNNEYTDAGRYTTTLEIVDSRYKGSITIDLVINRAVPETDFSVVDAVWNENLHLYDIKLPAGYAWDLPDTKIENVGESAYPVTYTHADSKNYVTVKGEFKVDVAKAEVTLIGVKDVYTSTYVKDTAFNATSGISTMFTDGTLSFEFYRDGELVDAMIEAGEYTMIIKVTEGTKYLGKTIERTVIINPAKNVEYVLTEQQAVYGQSIDVLTLPAGNEGYWIWVNAGDTVGNAGENKYIAKYIPTTGNYAEREVEVTVKVDKCEVKVPTIDDRYFINDVIKSGLTDTDRYEVVLSTDIGGTSAGTYSVTLKLKEAENYKWENTDGTSDLYVITYKILTASITNLTITLDKILWKYEDSYATITTSKTESFGEIVLVYSTSENGTYSETKPTDAGTYYVKAIVRAEDDSETPDWSYAETEPISFTIEKDSASITGIKNDSDYKYTYNFADIDITGGIDIDHNELDADDLVFEYWLGTTKVDLIKDPGTYTVKIIASETTNYNAVTEEFTVVVSKIENEDTVDDTILYQKATYGDDISNIKLPEHTAGVGVWSVITTGETVGNAGTNTFTVKFTPSQANSKYYAEREITVTVEVDRKDVLRPTLSFTSGIYNGSPYIPVLIHRDDSTLYSYTDFSDILTVGAENVGTYIITFSLGDNASNYRWENGDSEFDLTLVITSDEDYTIGVTVDEWIYNDSNENDSKIHVTVPDGVAGEKTIEYFVKNENGEYVPVSPNDAGTYYVRVTVAGDNSGNGNWSEKSTDYIEFTIGKDTVDFGTIELDAIYNQTLADIASELPDVPEGTLTWNAPDTVVGNAGYTYTFYATYTSSTENYNNNNAVPIKVTVGKAASVISGFVDKTVDFIGSDYRAKIENAVTVTGTGTLDFTVKLGGETVDEIKNQGTYTVYVTYTGDSNYEAITELEPITVVVNAITVEPTVSISGWTYAPDNSNASAPIPVKPEFVADSYLSYYYTGMTNAGVAYADSAVPTEAGNYTVTLTVGASELGNWAMATDSCDFIIERADASISLNTDQSTSYTGNAYDILSTVTVEKGVGAPDFDVITFNGTASDFTEIIGAGAYVLTVYLPESDNYYRTEVENVVVDVERATTSITGLAGFTKDYADTDYLGLVMSGVEISVPDGVNAPENSNIVFTVNGVEVDENTKIINQGVYTVVATYAGDENYKESTDSCTVTVEALETLVDSISGIDGKTYDKSALEATVTLTNTYTDPIVKYYVKNGNTYTWLGVDENGDPILPVNAGTYRIGISALGDSENGNWSALEETYSSDFTISWVIVPYVTINNKPYTGQHVPSGYPAEGEWRYVVEEGTANIDVGTYDVIFTLNNLDGIINFVWGYYDEDGKLNVDYDENGDPIVSDYKTSYKILSADDNVWDTEPSIDPIEGKDNIIYLDGFVISAAPKFGGFDVTFYKYNPETGKYDIEVGRNVYLRNAEGELYLDVDETPEDAGSYRAVFTFNDPNHMTYEAKTVNFTIERREVLLPEFSITSGIYNDSVYLPVLTHKDDKNLYTYTDLGDLLVNGAKNAGTYTVTFSLGDNVDNYKWQSSDADDDGVIELTLVISPNEDYEIGVTIDEWIYNDTDTDAKINVTVPAGVIGEQTVEFFKKNADGTYVSVTPKDQGTYYVKVTVAADDSAYGNWSEESTDYIEFTVIPDDLDFGTIELEATFGDTLGELELPTTLDGVDIEGRLEWNVSETTEVGTVAGPNIFTVKYVPDEKGNYNCLDEITVNISVERLGITVPDLIKDSFEFDNTEVTLEELFGTDTFVGFTAEIEENTNAREEKYTVTLILDGNHKWILGENLFTTDNQEHKFSITKAAFADDITVEIAKDEWIYGDAATKLNRTGIPAFIASDLISYRYVGVDVDYDSDVMPDKVGTYNVYVVVKATNGGNWDEQQSTDFAEFTITPKQLTVKYFATDLVYGGASSIKDFNHYEIIYNNISLEGALTGDKVSVLKDNTVSVINAGDYTVTLELTGDDANNYSLNVDHIDVTVYTKTTTVDIIINNKYVVDGVEHNGKYYDSVAVDVEVTDRNHDFGTETVKYCYKDKYGAYQSMPEGEIPTNAGEYMAIVTITADTDHTVPNWQGVGDTVEFTIEKAVLAPTLNITGWVYDPDNKNAVTPTYGNIPEFVAKSYLSEFTYSGTSFSGITYDGTTVPKDAGNSYTVYFTIAADTVNNNWDEVTVSKTFSITRAPVSITFTPAVLDYNGANRYEDIQKMFSSDSGANYQDFILTVTDASGNSATPINQGKYRVSATLLLTHNYQAASYPTDGAALEVEIRSISTDVTINSESYEITTESGSIETVVGKVYDKDAIEIIVSDRNHSFGTETVTYYEKDENGEYTISLGEIAPSYAGSFKAVVTITGSDDGNWPAEEKSVEFVINPAPSKIEVSEEVASNNNTVAIDYNTGDKTFESLIGAGAVGYLGEDHAEVIYTITGYTKLGAIALSAIDDLPTEIKNAGIYTVLVTLKSNSNYVDAEPVEITVTVEKADYQLGSYSISATYGQTLADVILPTVAEGILTWNIDVNALTTSVGNAGTAYFIATYVCSTGNFNDSDNVSVEITVEPAEVTIEGLKESYTFNYSGQDVLDDIKKDIIIKSGDNDVTDEATLIFLIGDKEITELKSGNCRIVVALADGGNFKASEAYTDVTFNPASVEIKNFAIDNNSILYSQTVTPSATMVINGDESITLPGPEITYLYSNDNGATWKTFDEIKNSGGYLNSGSYLVKAVVIEDEAGGWKQKEEITPLSFTVGKLVPNKVEINFTGDKDASNNYYQNSIVINYNDTVVKYVDSVSGISIPISGTLTEIKDSFRFKGADSIYVFSFTPTGHYVGNVVVDENNKATLSEVIALKVVAVVGTDYTTTYTYPDPDASPVVVGNAFGTIEDAVKAAGANGTTWVIPDNSGFVVIKDDINIAAGATLILPYLNKNSAVEKNTIRDDSAIVAVYNNSNGPMGTVASALHIEECGYESCLKKTTGCTTHIKCKLCSKLTDVDALGEKVCPLCSTKVVLEEGFTITVNGTLEISGQLDGGGGGSDYAGHTSGYHARLYLENNSEVVVNGVLRSAGFIIDNSEESEETESSVTVNNGGALYQPFTLRDFKGGSRTAGIKGGMEKYGAAPFRQFEYMNVQPKVVVKYGGYVRTYANIYAGDQYNAAIAPMIGADITGDTSFIQLTTESSYLVAKYNPKTEITKLDIYGGAKTNMFQVSIDTGTFGVQTVSSKEFVFPISWMYDISLNAGDYEMLEGNRFKLFPGAKFKIASDATLKIDHLSVYDSFIDVSDTRPYPKAYLGSSSLAGTDLPAAKLTVNGKLYATALGGRVYTENDGAIVKVADLNTSDNISTSIKITNYEPVSYSLGGLAASFGSFNTTLKLYYNGNMLGFTLPNRTYTSATVNGKTTWVADPEFTDADYPTAVDLTFTGLDNTNESYYVRTDEAIRYNSEGKPEYYTFEYDSSVGGSQTVWVFEGAEIVFRLTRNQIVVNSGTTSYKVEANSSLENAILNATDAYEVVWTVTSNTSTHNPVVYHVPALVLGNEDNHLSGTITYNNINDSSKVSASVEFTASGEIGNGGYLSMTVFGVDSNNISFKYSGVQGTQTDAMYKITGTESHKNGKTVTITATVTITSDIGSEATVYATQAYKKGTIEESGSCITPDTLITLADGTQVRVDSLTGNEMLLVWNLETGRFDYAPIMFVDSEALAEYEVVYLHFSDGSVVKVIYEHGFWDYDLNKYVYLDSNAADYIGHYFAKQNGDELAKVQLTDVEIKTELTTAWSPVTVGHLCYFVNGMLSMPGGVGGLFNIFDVDAETLMYDFEAMQKDIETYGLYTYEELNAICPLSEAMFEAAGGAYLKVSIGKGNLTEHELIRMINRYSVYFE